MASKKCELPTRFFMYGSSRDDDDSGNAWTAKFVKDCNKAYDAKIYGFKIYKHKRQNFPFIIKTNNDKDFVVGRILEFPKHIFDEKMKHSDHINGYDENRNDSDNYYNRIIVDAFLQNDSHKTTEKVNAISYIQKNGKTPLSQCIEIPFNDWMKRHTLNVNKNDNIYNKKKKYQKIVPSVKKKKDKQKTNDIDQNTKDDEKKNDDKLIDDDNGDKICKYKFEHWLVNQLGMSQYLESFKNHEIDNIKFIEFLNNDTLKDVVGINNIIHRQFIMKKVDVFKQNKLEFDKYLNNNDELKKYKQRFEEIGICNMEHLNDDIKDIKQLKYKLNILDDNTANNIWSIIHPQEGH